MDKGGGGGQGRGGWTREGGVDKGGGGGQGGVSRDALEGKAPERRPQERSDRRLEEVSEAVGGGYCRLQTP